MKEFTQIFLTHLEINVFVRKVVETLDSAAKKTVKVGYILGMVKTKMI